MIAFFSVHCSKKKGGGLGLGILALAGGGGSSSSSSGDSTDKPKDDPNNDPEFDEVKKKIESTIKFPTKNENKVLSNFNSVDLSITGGFFEDLGKLQKVKKVKMEYSVSAGSKTTATNEIEITQQFVTDKKVPITLNLSSIQPDTGFTQPKLKLKFSADDKQIILKEWTQNFFLEGTKQTPVITYKDKSDQEKTVENILTVDYLLKDPTDSDEKILIKVSVPKGIPEKIETRIQVKALSWSTGPHNATFSPSLSPPTQADDIQNFKEFDFDESINYTIASQLFYRLKGTKDWKSTTPFTNYYVFNDMTNSIKVQANKLFIKKEEKLRLTVTIPNTTDDTIKWLFLKAKNPTTILQNVFVLTGSNGSERTGGTIPANKAKVNIKSIVHEPQEPKEIKRDQKYTINITFEENRESLATMTVLIDYNNEQDKGTSFQVKVDTKN